MTTMDATGKNAAGLVATLRHAWAAFWTLRKKRDEPAWARVLIAASVAFALAFMLVMLAGLLRLSWFNPYWWQGVALPLLGVAVVAGLCLLALFRALELLASEAALEWLHMDASWRSALILNGLAAGGMLLGCAIGMEAMTAVHRPASWFGLDRPRQRIHFGLIIMVLIGANVVVWTLRARRHEKRRRATEAQLHLLQAQIEPQFLFNTLADVQQLLDQEPERARQMLEEFTDYLRASLGQLRRADTSLDAELHMAQCYLQLMELRMGARLAFSIDASADARAAVLPPLLLQPLVENAIRHGLEPRSEGGSLRIEAHVRGARVEIAVADDGVGLSADWATNGLALNNIHARLQARHGAQAALVLTRQGAGTRAVMTLPWIRAEVPPSS